MKLTYTPIPARNTVVVGTRHTLNAEADRKGKREFLNELRTWDRLAIEGNACETQHYRSIFTKTGSRSYELLAMDEGRCQKLYLEGNALWHSLANKYSMPNVVFETLDALAVVSMVINYGIQVSEEGIFNMRGRYECEEGEENALPNVGLQLRLRAVLTHPNMSLPKIGEATYLYTFWYAHIRDYENICPKLDEFTRGEEKKGIIVGQTHVPNMIRFLEKGKIEIPMNWEDFKRDSPAGRKWGRSTQQIEDIIASV